MQTDVVENTRVSDLIEEADRAFHAKHPDAPKKLGQSSSDAGLREEWNQIFSGIALAKVKQLANAS